VSALFALGTVFHHQGRMAGFHLPGDKRCHTAGPEIVDLIVKLLYAVVLTCFGHRTWQIGDDRHNRLKWDGSQIRLRSLDTR
jgi:hypothetical protein